MAADYTLNVTTLTPVDQPERAWCEACRLPSLLVWHVAIEADGNLLGNKLTTLRICTDCGSESWT